MTLLAVTGPIRADGSANLKGRSHGSVSRQQRRTPKDFVRPRDRTMSIVSPCGGGGSGRPRRPPPGVFHHTQAL